VANHAGYYNIGSITLAALGTAVLICDSEDLNELQVGAAYTYATTASTSGLTCNLTNGIGPTDTTNVNQRFWLGTTPAATIYYDSVGTTVTMNPVGVSIGTPQTVCTVIPVDLTTKGQWIKLTFINKDATNGCSIQFVADLA
jgi:hypothetical protein